MAELVQDHAREVEFARGVAVGPEIEGGKGRRKGGADIADAGLEVAPVEGVGQRDGVPRARLRSTGEVPVEGST